MQNGGVYVWAMEEADKMAERLRLEDWIGKRVTVNLDRGPATEPFDDLVGIEGFLEGVDPMGIILLFSPRDVVDERGPARPPPDIPPRHVFYPWLRVQLIERIEAEGE
jgi:hypothetical protein